MTFLEFLASMLGGALGTATSVELWIAAGIAAVLPSSWRRWALHAFLAALALTLLKASLGLVRDEISVWSNFAAVYMVSGIWFALDDLLARRKKARAAPPKQRSIGIFLDRT